MSSTDYYLLIDTSTEVCSAALGTADGVVAYLEAEGTNKHSEQLAALASDLLDRIDYRSDLRGIGVADGPGSYTGLRIGASYAKGLAWTLDIPLATVKTTDLLAMTFLAQGTPLEGPSPLLMPMIDARRMEVYTALLGVSADRVLTPETEIAAVVLTDNESRERLKDLVGGRPLCYFGSGAEKAQSLFDTLLPSSHFVPRLTPRADAMLGAVLDKITRGETEDVAYWEPYYLKEYEAKKSVNKVLSRIRPRP